MGHSTSSSVFVHKHKDVKTIGLSQDAYDVLRHLKQPGESFSDVVLRLTGVSWLLRFAGTMDDETASHYDRVIEEGRAQADGERDDRLRWWSD